MTVLCVLTCVLLIVPFGGCDPLHSSPSAASKSRKQQVYGQVEQLRKTGRLIEAGALAERSAAAAQARGDYDESAFFWYHAYHSYFETHQLHKAIAMASLARSDALRARNLATASVACYGLASVYYRTGNLDLARESASEMLAYARGASRKMELHSLMGAIEAAGAKPASALEHLQRALDEASAGGDLKQTARVREQLGLALLKAGDTGRADSQLLESYRLRKLLFPENLGLSYYNLGKLRIAQGMPAEAVHFLTLALAAQGVGIAPQWIYLQRALAFEKLGQPEQRLADLRKAMALSREFRSYLPPGDNVQIRADGQLRELYTHFVRAMIERYRASGAVQWLEEAFGATLEHHAASLKMRTEVASRLRERLPAEYWTKLMQFRRTQTEAARQGSATANTIRLRADLEAMESTAGLDVAYRVTTPGDWRELRAALLPGERFFTFHLEGGGSYVFTLTRTGLAVHGLPPQAKLAESIGAFRKAIETRSTEAGARGAKLYRDLFGGIRSEDGEWLWTIVPDDVLFELPFAALVTGQQRNRPEYLVERRAIRLAPGGSLFRKKTVGDGGFLGVGDPISNVADPRWGGRGFFRRMFSRTGQRQTGRQLARLAASAEEVERCARRWGGTPTMLLGPDANPAAVGRALSAGPSVAHFATHIYRGRGLEGASPIMMFGLDPRGELEAWTTGDIAALPSAPEFVALSGCGSGQGPLAPGAGLLGLTRAWLMAGSQAVAASYWPTLDDTGELFAAYYFHLKENTDPVPSRRAARALRAAQTEVLSRGRPEDVPARWGAYFVIGTI